MSNATDMYRAQEALPIGVSKDRARILPRPNSQNCRTEREREPRSGTAGVNHGPGILPRDASGTIQGMTIVDRTE